MPSTAYLFHISNEVSNILHKIDIFFFLRVMHDNFIIHSYPTLQIKVHLLTADNALND